MKSMTVKEFKLWIKNHPFELTKTECSTCGRRTESCQFCNTLHNQPERLSEMGSKE